MNEEEWLTCADRKAMLLDQFGQGASSRKLHLFTCGCFRRVWDRIDDEAARLTIEIAERFADGLASLSELKACQGSHEAADVAQESGWYAAWYAGSGTELLRDVIGNPFCPISFNCSWLVWNDSTVPKLAQSIYDNRAFDRMPLLADALEDAGCDDADILSHCRTPGDHVRGCWVVDLLLGKS